MTKSTITKFIRDYETMTEHRMTEGRKTERRMTERRMTEGRKRLNVE